MSNLFNNPFRGLLGIPYAGSPPPADSPPGENVKLKRKPESTPASYPHVAEHPYMSTITKRFSAWLAQPTRPEKVVRLNPTTYNVSPSPIPCKFLCNYVTESEVTGCPNGTHEVCVHPHHKEYLKLRQVVMAVAVGLQQVLWGMDLPNETKSRIIELAHMKDGKIITGPRSLVMEERQALTELCTHLFDELNSARGTFEFESKKGEMTRGFDIDAES